MKKIIVMILLASSAAHAMDELFEQISTITKDDFCAQVSHLTKTLGVKDFLASRVPKGLPGNEDGDRWLHAVARAENAHVMSLVPDDDDLWDQVNHHGESPGVFKKAFEVKQRRLEQYEGDLARYLAAPETVTREQITQTLSLSDKNWSVKDFMQSNACQETRDSWFHVFARASNYTLFKGFLTDRTCSYYLNKRNNNGETPLELLYKDFLEEARTVTKEYVAEKIKALGFLFADLFLSSNAVQGEGVVEGDTWLHVFARAGNRDVWSLGDSYSRRYLRNKEDKSPYELLQEYTNALNYLLVKAATLSRTTLERKIAFLRFSSVAEFLAHEAPIQEEGLTIQGDTWLHVFARAGNTDMLEINESDQLWHQQNVQGETPREAKELRSKMINLLERARELSQQELIDEASLFGYSEVYDFLRQKAPVIDRKTDEGDTWFHVFARINNRDVLSMIDQSDDLWLVVNKKYVSPKDWQIHHRSVNRSCILRKAGTITSQELLERLPMLSEEEPYTLQTFLQQPIKVMNGRKLLRKATWLHEFARTKNTEITQHIAQDNELWSQKDSTGKTPFELLKGPEYFRLQKQKTILSYGLGFVALIAAGYFYNKYCVVDTRKTKPSVIS